MPFGTIVVVGGSIAEPEKLQLYERLVEAMVKGGGDLSRNPRNLMAEVPCNAGQEAWDMIAGETPFRVVVTGDAGKTGVAKGDVLSVKFVQSQRKTLKFMKGVGGDGTLTVSERINPNRVPQLVNQVVADLVVNDRRDRYLLGGEKKTRHSSRQRERNSRQKERYGGLW